MSRDLARPRHELRRIARTLHSDRLPVSIDDILAATGVTITEDDSLSPRAAFLRYDPKRNQAPRIVINGSARTTSWGRFCMAHEIAHYFLIREFDLTPRNSREYWKIEEVCDEFARHLLMPDDAVAETFSQRPDGVLGLWRLCAEFARRAQLPWVQVGKRIGDFAEGCGFLRVGTTEEGNFIVTGTSLSSDRGRGTKLIVETQEWRLCKAVVESSRSSLHYQLEDWTGLVPPKGKIARIMNMIGASAVIAGARSAQAPHVLIAMGTQPANGPAGAAAE